MTTAKHDTPAKLRRALADLLADVTTGAVKNGGNPWSLASVKAASMALTGDKFGFSAPVFRVLKIEKEFFIQETRGEIVGGPYARKYMAQMMIRHWLSIPYEEAQKEFVNQRKGAAK